MIDWLFGKLAAKWWQRRTRSWHPADNKFAAEWEAIFPEKCLYCSYTRWANGERGQRLKLEPHKCKEGNSPPEPLPKAKVIKR